MKLSHSLMHRNDSLQVGNDITPCSFEEGWVEVFQGFCAYYYSFEINHHDHLTEAL
ncbi:MAG: hypothetical protein NT007_11515 [Candidatus Kapabacteria bacterium]|nr:hypothetical protein [Candidatus Kapabacteria bacterium]